MPDVCSRPEYMLKHYFGYDSFREGQRTLVDAVLDGRDVLGIMPTGAGKSICFQIPALLMDGITLVISPLISLMKDQVRALNQVGIHAAFLNSSLSAGQYRKALLLAERGQYKIIYVAPERLETEGFLRFALSPKVKISFLAVDEAHCVSQWGQDFRPSYLKILDFLEKLPYRPVLGAYTATATADVRDDILDILKLQEPLLLTTGFDRKNLFYSVKKPVDKFRELKAYLSKKVQEDLDVSGIIYCLTRKKVEEVCFLLRQEGYSVTRYHAGLSDEERQENQEAFINDRKQIMVATNAFGMGIDKADVRFVVHYNMPKNMESYYQEAGRAGRDGEPSECILYYEPMDVRTNRFFIDNNEDNEELDELTREIVKQRDEERLQKMTFYCFKNTCLRQYILEYFGENGPGYCGNCQNCLTEYEDVDITREVKAILFCIRENRWSYGTTMIVDILRGAKNQKLTSKRLNENSQYGALSDVTVPRLRQIIQELLSEGYLAMSEDTYPTLKLTEWGAEFAKSGGQITMKLAREQADTITGKGRKQKQRTGAAAVLSEKEHILFERLRAVRKEIAAEEHVPPYMVFSDKTLAGMSRNRPATLAGLRLVPGVGDYKLKKYGERFLQVICQYQ